MRYFFVIIDGGHNQPIARLYNLVDDPKEQNHDDDGDISYNHEVYSGIPQIQKRLDTKKSGIPLKDIGIDNGNFKKNERQKQG